MGDTPRTDALLSSKTEPVTAVKEFMRALERELAATTAERNTMKTALESVESERIKYRERAWHAESQLEMRYGLRKEIHTELGLTDETGDEALRKGLETIQAIKAELNGLKEKFVKAFETQHEQPHV